MWLRNKAIKMKLDKSNHLDLIFAALSDKTRRRILMLLLEDDMSVTDIAEPFDTSLAAISKHLIVLEKAGLITRERKGRISWCKILPDALRDAVIWIESFGQVQPFNLDTLEEFIALNLKGNI